MRLAAAPKRIHRSPVARWSGRRVVENRFQTATPVAQIRHFAASRNLSQIRTGAQDESASKREETNQSSSGNSAQNKAHPLSTKMLEAAATAFASLLVLGTGFAAGGYLYHRFYKMLVLRKMEGAFQPGDPVLELAAIGKQMPNTIASSDDLAGEDHWILRDEQAKIDAIVDGTERGHYHLLIGEKGTGKSSMLLDAMKKVEGEGISMFEAHADLEIFRIRLGKALDFEFHEDYIGSYFSERGPRDSTALLDIERALNKLEKVALKRRKRIGRPLVLIVNAVHLLRDDEDGRDLLELLQQRAEQWAASNLVTVVFNSDDYWVYERLKVLATRMEVTSITDLPKAQAVTALSKYRQKYFQETPNLDILSEVYNRVGGRLTFLNRVARSKDMLKTCDNIAEIEKTWFLNQCWILGMEMDDDVMDQQKYASAAMVLALALVKAENELQSKLSLDGSHNIPQIPLHKARQIMTRADFIKEYDHVNLFTITSTANVRADSVPMQRAFRDICQEEGFEDHLEKTLQRISDIESLGRTREIVAKDLVLGGKYSIATKDGARRGERITEVTLEEKPEEEDENLAQFTNMQRANGLKLLQAANEYAARGFLSVNQYTERVAKRFPPSVLRTILEYCEPRSRSGGLPVNDVNPKSEEEENGSSDGDDESDEEEDEKGDDHGIEVRIATFKTQLTDLKSGVENTRLKVSFSNHVQVASAAVISCIQSSKK
ncbi:hypothetical protein G7Y89_g9230 [Cudoniella acicularis]|uniref:Orc1-like AAA ATPase domain-containing protein n=1 Tax=Cudoniella acicularis TaxID=354080 RepID=A0A8H4RH98_9HELO|nr:hypothetical protein G7Y89_g9230 [Cudoniella acicularis]